MTTDDGGAGSLRQAIIDANSTLNVGGAPDLIGFSIPRPFTNGLLSWYRGDGNAGDAIGANSPAGTIGATAVPTAAPTGPTTSGH